jgi:oligopeptide transport system permease protein
MFRLLASRLIQGVFTLLLLFTLTFVLVRLMPGNPYVTEKAIPAHVLEMRKKEAGLGKPQIVQYAIYLRNMVVEQDLGILFKKDGVRVTEVIKSSFPVSLTLGLLSMGIALMVGIPAGVVAAVRKNSLVDYSLMSGAMLGICLPSFVIGPFLAVTFGLHLGWLNVAGWNSWSDWILPALTLGLINAAYLARLSRGGMLEILTQDFIRTARAKGVPGHRVITRHTLRGGLLPAITFLGPAFAGMISGSFVIETIFQIPGMGQHFVNAITDREYDLIQGLVLFYGILILAANMAVDLLQIAINPRLRNAS